MKICPNPFLELCFVDLGTQCRVLLCVCVCVGVGVGVCVCVYEVGERNWPELRLYNQI